jgi:hypothetical protein
MGLLIALLFGVFVLPQSDRAKEFDPYPITDTDKKFLAEVINAVENTNDVWVADHMSYPLSITVSNKTQVVNTREEFKSILSRQLTKDIRAKIIKEARQPLFKNWQGIMIGRGIVWITEFERSENGPPEYEIMAIGDFAFQTEENVGTVAPGQTN